MAEAVKQLCDYVFTHTDFLDFQYLYFLYPRNERHIRRSVPFLPCGIVSFNLCGFGIVLADFLGQKIDTVGVEHL